MPEQTLPLDSWHRQRGARMDTERMAILHQVWEREAGHLARHWALDGVKRGVLYVRVGQAVDADLLARCMAWAGETEAARNEMRATARIEHPNTVRSTTVPSPIVSASENSTGY